MKKINIGHQLITNKSNWVGTLREVNKLLEKVNLKIQFQNSNFYTNDMVHKDEKDIPDTVYSEIATEIVLYEIEDQFDYIFKSRDFKKLKQLILKHEEDKKKIEETIKLLRREHNV
jgi:outer membrane protein assembly factor BamE (lipoprotein component of BamABCDE complex)